MQFVYPESMFTASALHKFVEVIKTAVATVLNDSGFQLARVSSSDYYYRTQRRHAVDG